MTGSARGKHGWKVAGLVLLVCTVLFIVMLLFSDNEGEPGEPRDTSDTVDYIVASILTVSWLIVFAVLFPRRRREEPGVPRPGAMREIYGKWGGGPEGGFPFTVDEEGGGNGQPADTDGEEPIPTRGEIAAEAEELLKGWRGEAYVFGLGVLGETGALAARFGKKALLVANRSPWAGGVVDRVKESLGEAGVKVVSECPGAKPNTPRDDVYRIQKAIEGARADLVVAVGGGSTLDAVKAAAALAAVSRGAFNIDALFGTGNVSAKLGRFRVMPIVAVETAASSASHLTKYANVTDVTANQKKLIIDTAIIPPAAVFDYALTASAPRELTIDGAFDGISHYLEVYYGAKGAILDKVEEVALTAIELILSSVRMAVTIPENLEARYRLGLGTDLGGYAIMTGSTSGGHLTSFSLVDVTTHGRATAIMNPYYTVLFANAIERQLRALAPLYARAGYLTQDTEALGGRDLALAVAGAMQAFARDLEAPTALGQLPGFSRAHIERALAAAKDPSLESKLKAMPVPMDAAMVDEYMAGVLEAAADGRLEAVKTLPSGA